MPGTLPSFYTDLAVTIRTVGVVGCGLMGSGIAEVCARAGYTTLVREISDELLGKGRAAHRAVDGHGASSAASCRRPTATRRSRDSAARPASKTSRSATWSSRPPPRTPRSRSARSPSWTRSARRTPSWPATPPRFRSFRWPRPRSDPDKVLGMHFMNPVPVMRLIEYVRTLTTSDETLETARAFRREPGQADHRQQGPRRASSSTSC